MPNINKVFVAGRLGNDPDVKQGGGTNIANLNIATSEKYKDKKSGELIENTEWHKVVCFGRTAEVAGQYLKKGSNVLIEGKLKTEKYTKDGIDKYSTKIICNSLQMLDSKNSSSKDSNNNSSTANQNDDLDDQDIPF